MTMPKSCLECPICRYDDGLSENVCLVLDKILPLDADEVCNKRYNKCPIEEK